MRSSQTEQLKTAATQSTVRSVNVKQLVFIFLSSLLVVACNQQEKPGAQEAQPSSPAPNLPAGAQPKLQTMKLYIGDQEMITELALRPREREIGMMFRTNMAENEGMLFVFAGPHRASFWMQNTLVPLSAAYINPQGVIEEIHKLEPRNTNPVTASSTNIQYVLETPQGWFARHNIEPGAIIKTEKGALQEAFSFQR